MYSPRRTIVIFLKILLKQKNTGAPLLTDIENLALFFFFGGGGIPFGSCIFKLLYTHVSDSAQSMKAVIVFTLVAIATTFGFPKDWETWKKVGTHTNVDPC